MVLDKIIATTKVVESNTLARHWTMSGPGFFGAHSYFDEIVDTLRDLLDWTAEAVGRTGDIPLHTLAGCIDESSVDEEYVVKSIFEMIVDESRELKILVGNIYDAIKVKDEVNPGMESALTDYADKIEQHCFWLDHYSQTYNK